jgi:hypothetical protein
MKYAEEVATMVKALKEFTDALESVREIARSERTEVYIDFMVDHAAKINSYCSKLVTNMQQEKHFLWERDW